MEHPPTEPVTPGSYGQAPVVLVCPPSEGPCPPSEGPSPLAVPRDFVLAKTAGPEPSSCLTPGPSASSRPPPSVLGLHLPAFFSSPCHDLVPIAPVPVAISTRESPCCTPSDVNPPSSGAPTSPEIASSLLSFGFSGAPNCPSPDRMISPPPHSCVQGSEVSIPSPTPSQPRISAIYPQAKRLDSPSVTLPGKSTGLPTLSEPSHAAPQLLCDGLPGTTQGDDGGPSLLPPPLVKPLENAALSRSDFYRSQAFAFFSKLPCPLDAPRSPHPRCTY